MAESTPGTKPTPAELVGLEHAFAVDAQSDAYRPLTEAYLALGRYMEAMVVGKAGMKAHPASPVPRILLARIYLQQGRAKKALEELDAGLALQPEDLQTILTVAELRAEGGDREGAAALVQRASTIAPGDAAVSNLAAKLGVELAAPPEPEPEPAPPPAALAPAPALVAEAEAPPVLDPVQRAGASAGGGEAGAPAHGAGQQADTPILQRKAAAGAAAPQPSRRAAPAEPRRPAGRPALDPTGWDLDEDEERPAAKGMHRQLVALLATAAVLVVGLGGWYFFTDWQKNREHEIAKLLDQTNDQLRKDNYASYKAAAASAERILELDSTNYVAHAYLAFINALRWGEQGEGDDFKRRAIEQLEKAKKAGQEHGRIVAADAYIQFFSGDAKGAEATIEKVLESGQRSGLLYTTLGTIQMWSGDLDQASASLKQAQALEPNSVRVLSALGQLHRRRGMDAAAWTFYDSALRIDGEHADSLVGKALLVLDANEADRPKADKEKLLAEAEVQIDKVLHLPDGAISSRQLAVAKFARAQLLFARDQRAEADRLEQEAFTLDPGNADIRLIRGRRLLREGDVDGAVADIREAIKLDGSRAAFYVDLSRALLAKSGGAPEAVAALETALKTYPNSGRLYVLLGDANRAVPAIDAARKSYEKALEVEGRKLPEARAKLGAIWREKKEFAKAEEEVELALKELGLTASGPTLAMALTEQGRIFDERPQGDVQQAFDRYVKAIEASETYAPPYYFLGKISAGQRDREQQRQAIQSLESYLRLAPKGEFAEDARVILGRLR